MLTRLPFPLWTSASPPVAGGRAGHNEADDFRGDAWRSCKIHMLFSEVSPVWGQPHYPPPTAHLGLSKPSSWRKLGTASSIGEAEFS